MALTQVRAKLGEEWVVLTYNESTGRYEGYLTPPGTSIHQPGGYYNITAEAVSESGETASVTGEQMASLRLVVRETSAPTLTLISPAPGYLQTQTPTFVFEATDEEGGSGVNPESFSVTENPPASADAAALPPLARGAYEAISGGYRFTWSPPEPWGEGAHTVTATVSDHDGNEAAVSGAYTVDTVPPELILRKPYQRHVVDDESVEVVVDAWDAVSGVASVTIGGLPPSPASPGPPPFGKGGFERYSADVPLSVGENHISVTVTDGAGNVTTAEVYMIRLVTDRTQFDVDFLRTLYEKPWEEWPEATQAWFLEVSCLRGAYDPSDWNRVGVAVRWLAGELERRGYIASVAPKTDWTPDDAPRQSQMAAYLRDVETVRSAQNLYVQEIPATLRFSTFQDWNNIEKALVEADAIFPNYFAWTSGEVTCGGV